MATQYTDKLKLALPTQGELSGTWGTVVNDNITSMIEEAIAGRSVINTWTTNAHTLTTADGTTSESRCAMLEFTDTGTALTGAGEVICPAKSKLYVAKNSAGQTITVKTSSGTGVAVPDGETMWVYCDGTNVEEAVTYITSLGSGQLDVDNIRIDGNTISSTDTNGNINITPNGTGDVVLGQDANTASVVYFGGRNSVPYAYVAMNNSSNYVEYVHANTISGMEARIHHVATSTNTGGGSYVGKLHGYSLGTQIDAMTWGNTGAVFPNDVAFTSSGADKITYTTGIPPTVNFVDGAVLQVGTDADIDMRINSNVASIEFNNANGYIVANNTLHIRHNHPLGGSSENMIECVGDGAVSLYYDGVLKCQTAVDGLHIHDKTLSFEGDTANTYETSLVADDPTADATISIPNRTGSLNVAKYTDFDLTPNATSTTINLTGDTDVRAISFRLKTISYSSGPTNPTWIAQNSSGVTMFWDYNRVNFNHYNDTTNYTEFQTQSDLLAWVNTYSAFPAYNVYNFYKIEPGVWTMEAIITTSTGSSTTQTYILAGRSDFGVTYDHIGKFVINSGSSYNITSLVGTIVEYY